MDSCDVLIVGGGPAGSSCAWGLRRSGLDVLIIDRSKFPRNKVCGGWITPGVLQLLEIQPEAYASTNLLQEITGFQIGAIGNAGILVDYARTVSFGVRRLEFDQYLLQRCGARLRQQTDVVHLERATGGWLINGEIKAKLLVGAGGHFCPVSRLLARKNPEPPVVAQEVEFRMTPEQANACAVRADVPEIYFCDDMRGYGWCFRKHEYLNIGLGRLDTEHLASHVARFGTTLRQTNKVPFEWHDKFCGHAYRIFTGAPNFLVSDGVMLIGDAAGLAYPQSGEGIRPAIESGLLAAEVISTAGDYSHRQLSPYCERLAEQLGSNSEIFVKVASCVPPDLRNAGVRLLLNSKMFCRHVVSDRWFLRRSDTGPFKAVKAEGPLSRSQQSASDLHTSNGRQQHQN